MKTLGDCCLKSSSTANTIWLKKKAEVFIYWVMVSILIQVGGRTFERESFDKMMTNNLQKTICR